VGVRDDSGTLGFAGTDMTSLRGVRFAFRQYRQYTVAWDHDHCSSCMAGFSEAYEGDLHEGWTTTAEFEPGSEYEWLCDRCFQRFKVELDLREVEHDRPLRPMGAPPDVGTQYQKPPRVHDAAPRH
jgi:hypothetical protein